MMSVPLASIKVYLYRLIVRGQLCITLFTLTNVTSAQRHLQISHAGVYGSPMGMYNMGWPGTYAASFNAIDHGKGKGREIDFEAAFEQVTASLASTQLNASRIEVVEEVTKEEQSDFDP
jgi:hypothetical protein